MTHVSFQQMPREQLKGRLAAALDRHLKPDRVERLLACMEKKRYLSEERCGRPERVNEELPGIADALLKNATAILWMAPGRFEELMREKKALLERVGEGVKMAAEATGMEMAMPASLLGIERLDANFAALKARFSETWKEVLKRTVKKHGVQLLTRRPHNFMERCESGAQAIVEDGSAEERIGRLRSRLVALLADEEVDACITHYIREKRQVTPERVGARLELLEQEQLTGYVNGRMSRLFGQERNFNISLASMRNERNEDGCRKTLLKRLTRYVGAPRAEETMEMLRTRRLAPSSALGRLERLEKGFKTRKTEELLIRGLDCLGMGAAEYDGWLGRQKEQAEKDRKNKALGARILAEMRKVIGDWAAGIIEARVNSLETAKARMKAAKEMLGQEGYSEMLRVAPSAFVNSSQADFDKCLARLGHEQAARGKLQGMLTAERMAKIEKLRRRGHLYSTMLKKLEVLAKYKTFEMDAVTYGREEFAEYLRRLRERADRTQMRKNVRRLLRMVLPGETAEKRAPLLNGEFSIERVTSRMNEVIDEKGILCLEHFLLKRWTRISRATAEGWEAAKQEIYAEYAKTRGEEMTEFQLSGAYGITLPFHYGIDRHFKISVFRNKDSSLAPVVKVQIETKPPFTLYGGEAGLVLRTLGAINSGNDEAILNEAKALREEVKQIRERLEDWYLGDRSDLMARLMAMRIFATENQDLVGKKVANVFERFEKEEAHAENYILHNYEEFCGRHYSNYDMAEVTELFLHLLQTTKFRHKNTDKAKQIIAEFKG